MASTVQYLRDKKQGSVVVKIEGNAADTTTLNASVITGLPADGTATIRRALWTSNSGDITITWKGSGADAVACRLSGNGNWNLTQNPPVIANNATTPSGNITIAKTGASVYSIILDIGTGAYSA
jgi:hypothetical protein|tara:strand:- start:1726 stop:2097 length:372 start_codon:yes stop_codon:yes gene_type:complete